MAFKIKEIELKNIEMLNQYFCFSTIHHSLTTDALQFSVYLENLPQEEKEYPIVQHLKELLQDPQRYLEMMEKKNKISFSDLSKFANEICDLYKTDARFFQTKAGIVISDVPKNGYPTPKDYNKYLLGIMQKLTNNGKREFTAKEKMEFIFFFYVHLMAEKFNISEADLQFLKDQFADHGELDFCGKTQIVLPDTQKEIVFPYYDGTKDKEETIQLLQIKNPSDCSKKIALGKTNFKRIVPAKRDIWALRKGNSIVGFLAPVLITNNTVSYLKRKTNTIHFETATEAIHQSIKNAEEIVSFSQSNKDGIFLVNKDGKLDCSLIYAKKEISMPEKPVVCVKSTNLDYGFLLKDGTFLGRIQKRNWNHLIDFVLTSDNGFAITADRTLINKRGEMLGRTVVKADACASHYLWLDHEGRVHTDSHLQLEEKVLDAGVFEKGYVIATEKEMKIYDFRNNCISCKKTETVISELYADGNLIVYLDENGNFQFYDE